MRRNYFILLITGLLILFGCGGQGCRLLHGEEAEMIYQGQCFWAAEEFPGLSEDNLTRLFNEKYDVDARDFNFTFNETSYSTITQCHVYGEISKSGDEYVAYFSWFLDPPGLDFINDNFEESETGLSWEGNIDGVPTSIGIECPPQESVYGVGSYGVGIGHCHAHIWWPTSSGNMVKCSEIKGEE